MPVFQLPRRVSTAWQGLLHPACLCRLCALPCRAPLCASCQAQHLWADHWRCARCALALPAPTPLCARCAASPPVFEQTLALADYAPPLDRLLLMLKFGDQAALGRWLGRQLGRRWRAADPGPADVVVPVPLSCRRLRERGYNQAWEVARGVAAELERPARADVLRRVRDNAPQSGLPASARAANVRHAFLACAKLHATRVLLVDDVLTSGSTLDAAARALLRAGAASVRVAVLLRTPAPH